jgi:pimeloyl-ACP methyl ester carboxylesterase
MAAMNERNFFFEGTNGPLYGVLYEPSKGPSARPGRGVVICDSLFEEKFWCERVMANLSRILADKGYTVCSFDYRGYGNSPGESEDVELPGLEQDIQEACDLLRQTGCDRIALLGIRWGAALAERAAASRGDVDALFLVNPVTSWRKAVLAALRANVAGQYSIFKKAVMTRDEIVKELTSGGDCIRSGYRMNNIDGYFLSRGFFEQSGTVTMPGVQGGASKPAVVFEIREGEGPPDPECAALVAAYQAAGARCEHVPVSGDGRFWINNPTFTSVTPNLYREVIARIAALDGGVAGVGAATAAGTGSAPGRAAGRTISATDSIVNGGVRETAVRFSGAGRWLSGIHYRSETGGAKDFGVVFTHGGLIGMNGAFRFHTRAARRLAREGIECLCFDPHGMGRSPNGIGNIDQRALFRKIQTGLFAGDVELAAAHLRERSGVRRIVLFGVCGGAITSIQAHGRSKGIDASVLLSIPVMLSGLSHTEIRMSEGYARFYLGMYTRKIFNPKAWWRFITFQSDYSMIGKASRLSISGAARRIMKRSAPPRVQDARAQQPAAAGGPQPGAAQAVEDAPPASGSAVGAPSVIAGSGIQFNEHFLAAYRAIVARGGKILFAFGENDNFRWEFDGEFVAKYPADVRAGEPFTTIEIVPDANHMYTLREWQDEILRRVGPWFEASGLKSRS